MVRRSSTNFNQSYNLVGSAPTTISQIFGHTLSPTTIGVPWCQQSFFWDPAKLNPKSQQWNVDLQQQVSKTLVTTIAYVGGLQTRVDLTIDENTATTPGPADATVVNARRPDLVGNPTISQKTRSAWFNQAAFAQPVYSYGNAPRGLYRNPPFQNMDASVFKNIPVAEKLSVQLRLEAFNALNLITLGSVNGSFTNNSNFGKITGIGSTPRILQIGAKIYF